MLKGLSAAEADTLVTALEGDLAGSTSRTKSGALRWCLLLIFIVAGLPALSFVIIFALALSA